MGPTYSLKSRNRFFTEDTSAEGIHEDGWDAIRLAPGERRGTQQGNSINIDDKNDEEEIDRGETFPAVDPIQNNLSRKELLFIQWVAEPSRMVKVFLQSWRYILATFTMRLQRLATVGGTEGSRLQAMERNTMNGLISLLPKGTVKMTAALFDHKEPKHLAQSVVLKPYQVLGVNWMFAMVFQGKGCLMADDMGGSELLHCSRRGHDF